MDTYYTNTTNATCKTNLVVRKHTLDSRIQEIKDELLKRATKLVLNKTKDTICKYSEKTRLFLSKNDYIREKVSEMTCPVFEATKEFNELTRAISRRQNNPDLKTYNRRLSQNDIHKNIKTIRKINRRKMKYDFDDNDCDKKDTSVVQKTHNHTTHIHPAPAPDPVHVPNHMVPNNMMDYEFLYFMKSNPVIEVNKLIKKLKKEDYEYLSSKLDPDYVSKLTTTLEELKKNASTIYKGVIGVYIRIVETIFLNVNLTKSLKLTLEKSQAYKADSEILRNREKLIEYINTLNNGPTALFKPVYVTTTLELKKRYRIYVEKYGYPENEIFDAELMLEIDRMIDNSDCSSHGSHSDSHSDIDSHSDSHSDSDSDSSHSND